MNPPDTKVPAFIWVSPYQPEDARGGWKAMQFQLLRTLESRLGAATRIAPVETPTEFWPTWISRFKKKLGLPRSYAYYSNSRLNKFAQIVESRLPKGDTSPVVFFGSLPFVRCQPEAPYYVYTDGAFFIHYWEYNQDHSHARADIDRIIAAEAAFLRNAVAVWCSSHWVAERITREYCLKPGKAIFVGTGPGNVPALTTPAKYEATLAMISADFERKGGRLAVTSVAAARQLGVNIRLQFIGAKPPADVLTLPFVEWCGWLNLQQDHDRARFAEILSRAGAQILLSRSDLTPLAIPEAASYGKATLAMAVGGIPEMIQDGRTGWLIKPEATASQIGQRIAEIFSEPIKLAEVGAAARSWCAANWSWPSTADRCLASWPNRN